MDTLIIVTNVLNVLIWMFPFLILTFIAYHIEAYTKFKTEWRLFLFATLLSAIHPIADFLYYPQSGMVLVQKDPLMSLILLVGPVMGILAAINLLKFQNLQIGKTKLTCQLFGVLAVLLPLVGYLNGLSISVVVDLLWHNVMVVSLIFMYMTIGKIARKYLAKYNILSYNAAKFGAITLLVYPLLMNYSYLMNIEAWSKLWLMALIAHLISGFFLAFAAILLVEEARTRGLHLKPIHESIEKKSVKYRLKRGHSYLVKEDIPKESFEIFVDMVSHDYNGLCISRTKPSEIREQYSLRTTPLLWLTKAKTDEKSIQPGQLERLVKIVEDFTQYETDSIVLLQRLDYLITQNSFESVLKSLQSMNDLIMPSNCILLTSINPSTLNCEQLALLTQELHDMGGVDTITLQEEVYTVLDFIYKENALNRVPSFKDISNKFSITKTTTRKRVHELGSKGLIRVVKEGKYKLLEITERGKNLLTGPIGPKGGE